MKTSTDNAIANAARIAFELGARKLTPDIYPIIDNVKDAAQKLAQIEAAPGFEWNGVGRTDWETACARIAVRLERGERCNLRVCRLCTHLH